MKAIENHMHTYNEAKTIMFPSGELGLALAIHVTTDNLQALEVDIESDMVVAVSFVDPIGYLIYHPNLAAGMTIFFKSLDEFENLGEL